MFDSPVALFFTDMLSIAAGEDPDQRASRSSTDFGPVKHPQASQCDPLPPNPVKTKAPH